MRMVDYRIGLISDTVSGVQQPGAEEHILVHDYLL